MSWRGVLSIILISVFLFSECRAAALDAPSTSKNIADTTMTSVKSSEEESVKPEEESHERRVRSVPAPETVLNYLPQDSDRDTQWSSEPMTREARVSQHKSYLSQWPAQSRPDTWRLEPQVGKRGSKRARGGEQSYYSRGRDPSAEELQLLSDSLEGVERGAATTMLSRQQRNGRRYDVPQIECPRSPDHMERFACPRPDRRGRFRCIDDRALCDGFYDCPDKEDENPDHCLFYKTTKAHLDILAEALLRWARGR